MRFRPHPFTALSRRRRLDAGKDADRTSPLPGRRKLLGGLALGLAILLAGGPGSAPTAAAADGVDVAAIRLAPAPDGDSFQLSADITLTLPPRLEEAVNKGVVLYFLLEAELYEPRWYWWDDKIASASQTYRLSYHALTRQYRLLIGGVQQQYGDLGEALKGLGALRDWRFVDADRIRYGARYAGQVRMRLDNSQLPKPFQLTAITNKDWTLQAEWKRFEFKP